MRIVLLGIGRMKAGPERLLLDRYCERARAIARSVGIGDVTSLEVEESRAPTSGQRKRDEAASARAKIPTGSTVIHLDERGRSVTSSAIAAQIGSLRDAGGVQALFFVVGGPDGLDDDWVPNDRYGFGSVTFPHQIVRILMAEQIYRSLTILAGHPYHRV